MLPTQIDLQASSLGRVIAAILPPNPRVFVAGSAATHVVFGGGGLPTDQVADLDVWMFDLDGLESFISHNKIVEKADYLRVWMRSRTRIIGLNGRYYDSPKITLPNSPLVVQICRPAQKGVKDVKAVLGLFDLGAVQVAVDFSGKVTTSEWSEDAQNRTISRVGGLGWPASITVGRIAKYMQRGYSITSQAMLDLQKLVRKNVHEAYASQGRPV